MREKFVASGLLRRALQGQYTCCRQNQAKEVTLPDGSKVFSLLIGFEDSEGVRRFNVHVYVTRDGIIAASGRLDPKFLLDDGNVAYKLSQQADPR